MDLNTKDCKGRTALILACINEHQCVVKIFLEYAQSCNIDLNAKDDLGKTALIWACMKGNLNLVKMFMDNALTLKINLNAEDGACRTAFDFACGYGFKNIQDIMDMSFNQARPRVIEGHLKERGFLL